MSDCISKKKLIRFLEIMVSEADGGVKPDGDDDVEGVISGIITRTTSRAAQLIIDRTNKGDFDVEIIA